MRNAFVAILFSSVVLSTNVLGEVIEMETRWKFSQPPSMNGVTIDTPLSAAEKIFGKPIRIDGVSGDDQSYYFNGFVVLIGWAYGSAGPTNPYVDGIDVTGKEIQVYPGVKVGMSETQMIDLLGPPSKRMRQGRDAEKLSWHTGAVAIFYVILRNHEVEQIGFFGDRS